MLSDTPASIAICFTPERVLTRSTISGGNRECIWRGSLSRCSFQSSFMFFTVLTARIFSSFCQLFRCGPPASVNQSAPERDRSPEKAARTTMGRSIVPSPRVLPYKVLHLEPAVAKGGVRHAHSLPHSEREPDGHHASTGW